MASVVITGGTGGLGTALAAELVAAGMSTRALSHHDLDVSDLGAINGWFASQPCPDLLVCVAGITRDALLLKLSEADWDEVLAVNLRGAYGCARAVAKPMMKRRSGHIVFISSHSAAHPPAGQVAYAAAKAGLLGLTRSLARELGPFGVRVNAILPGFLETPMTARLPPTVVARTLNSHILNRFNTPAEVAAFLRCLHLRMAATSGQIFNLDSRIL